jgi:hypothetical protein
MIQLTNLQMSHRFWRAPVECGIRSIRRRSILRRGVTNPVPRPTIYQAAKYHKKHTEKELPQQNQHTAKLHLCGTYFDLCARRLPAVLYFDAMKHMHTADIRLGNSRRPLVHDNCPSFRCHRASTYLRQLVACATIELPLSSLVGVTLSCNSDRGATPTAAH